MWKKKEEKTLSWQLDDLQFGKQFKIFIQH